MLNAYKIYTYPGMFLYYFFLAVGAVLLLAYEKGEGVLWLNHQHTPVLDVFFKYWTFLGDGMFFIIILVFFIFRSYFYLLLTIVSILIQTIFVQGLKRFIFPDLVRPKLFFDDFFDLHKVEGIDIHAQHAFPSGHTATAFTIALIFSLYVKNKNWSFVFILAALFVGLSRIYLLQHFLVDIYFGSLIGIISVILSDYLIGKSNYLRQRLS